MLADVLAAAPNPFGNGSDPGNERRMKLFQVRETGIEAVRGRRPTSLQEPALERARSIERHFGLLVRRSQSNPLVVGPAAARPGGTIHGLRRCFRARARRALWIALGANAEFLAADVVGGLTFGSLALLADAAQLASDVLGFLAWIPWLKKVVAGEATKASVGGNEGRES